MTASLKSSMSEKSSKSSWAVSIEAVFLEYPLVFSGSIVVTFSGQAGKKFGSGESMLKTSECVSLKSGFTSSLVSSKGFCGKTIFSTSGVTGEKTLSTELFNFPFWVMTLGVPEEAVEMSDKSDTILVSWCNELFSNFFFFWLGLQ